MKAYIVNMKGKLSVTHPNMTYGKGFALYLDDVGFLSLDGVNVYVPAGGRKALKAILDGGLDGHGYHYIYP